MATTRRRPLKIGLYLPNGDGPMGGGVRRWSDVLALARQAEGVGFDSLWVADHMIFRFERQAPQSRWECWSLLAALAAVTTTVEIGPLVSCMGFRNPALLAKIAETVDEISGGRLILGLGAGWHEPEFTAYGYPFDHRISRFEEGFAILRRLLREGRADVQGRYHRANDCELRPRGPRPAGPPLLIGSTGERMLRLCARHADLWNMTWIGDPAEVAPARELVDAACEAVGRDPATLARTACIVVDLSGRVGRGSWGGEPTPPPLRSTAELATLFHAFANEGLSQVQVWLDPSSAAGIEAFAPVLELLDRG